MSVVFGHSYGASEMLKPGLLRKSGLCDLDAVEAHSSLGAETPRTMMVCRTGISKTVTKGAGLITKLGKEC